MTYFCKLPLWTTAIRMGICKIYLLWYSRTNPRAKQEQNILLWLSELLHYRLHFGLYLYIFSVCEIIYLIKTLISLYLWTLVRYSFVARDNVSCELGNVGTDRRPLTWYCYDAAFSVTDADTSDTDETSQLNTLCLQDPSGVLSLVPLIFLDMVSHNPKKRDTDCVRAADQGFRSCERSLISL